MDTSDVKWNSFTGLGYILVALSSAYIFLSSQVVFFKEFHSPEMYTNYYFCVLTLLVILSFRNLRRLNFSTALTKSQKIQIACAAGVTLLCWWIYRRPMLLHYPVWFDEAAQFLYSPSDLGQLAAMQQQPPIDYFLSHFSRLIFGIGEWPVIFHAAVFSVLGLFLFALLQVQIGLSFGLAIVPILFFSTLASLVKASSEGRPVSLAVYFALIWLMFAVGSIKSRKTHSMGLMISSTLLLFSIGLQPVFFIALMIVSLAPFYINQTSKKEFARFVLFAGVLPFALAVPIFFKVHESSSMTHQFYRESYFSIWLRYTLSLDWLPPQKFMDVFNNSGWLLLILPIFPAVLALIFHFKSFKRFRAAVSSTLTMALYLVLFPVLFQIFWSIINWSMFTRYFVLWPVGLTVLIPLCLSQWLKLFDGKIQQAVVATCVLISGFGAYKIHADFYPHQLQKIALFRAAHFNWGKLQKIARPGYVSVFVEMPYVKFNDFLYQTIAAPVYLQKPTELSIPPLVIINDKKSIQALRIGDRLKNTEHVDDLFFIFARHSMDRETFEGLAQYFFKQKLIVHRIQDNYFVVQIIPKDDFMVSVKEFLENTVAYQSESPRNVYLLESLIHESLREKTHDVVRWQKHLKSLPLPPEVLQQLSIYPTYQFDKIEYEKDDNEDGDDYDEDGTDEQKHVI